jgi:cell division protein FtsI/penicillin-binding protein 2
MLTRASRWFGIDDRQRLDLAINLPESTGLKRHSGEAHDVLFPQLARSTLATMVFNQDDWGARELMMYTTALNGIGQTISASPLQMTLPAAAIATGQRVRPYLFARWGGESLSPPEPTPLPVDTELLEILRSGMKAVPEVGTASRAFPRPLACRVYGKTGTAEIDAVRSYNSGWFIGWREPAGPSQRRLAFACMTTHATGSYRFGGTACAPVVSRMLQGLDSATDAAG